MDVGFIGLGLMGGAMARNLVKAGHGVQVWNRSPEAIQAVAGARGAPSPRDVFQSDVVFTMLSDDAAIRDVILASGALAGARPGVIHVVTSTISVSFAEELQTAHAQAGLRYLSAPVFGRPDVAEAGQLQIVAAGEPAAIAAVQPLFDVIGKKTWVMGDDPKQANAAKIGGNMMIAMAIEAMAEAVALAGRHGVAPDAFLDLMTQTLFGGRVYENYGAKIVSGDYEAGFRMRLGLKDLNLAADASSGSKLPMLDAVRGQMKQAMDAGMGERDWSALADYTLNHDR